MASTCSLVIYFHSSRSYGTHTQQPSQSLQTKSRSNNGDNRHDDDTGDADEDDAGKHDDTTRLLRVSPNTTTTTTTTTKTSTSLPTTAHKQNASVSTSTSNRLLAEESIPCIYRAGPKKECPPSRLLHSRYCSLLTVADSTELRFTPPAAARKAV